MYMLSKSDAFLNLLCSSLACTLAWPTNDDRLRIERVQKSALCIILGENYHSYRSALKQVKLESLYTRRNKLCKKFAQKSLKNSKFCKWFKPNDRKTSTRLIRPKFCEVVSRTERFRKSPISFLTDVLNKKWLWLVKNQQQIKYSTIVTANYRYADGGS